MKPFRVLSIDWDYFVNATLNERLEMFPDGGNENLPDGISKFVWSTRYATYPQLRGIEVDVDALDILKGFISKNYCKAVVVDDSHRGIWDAIVNHYQYKSHRSLDLINIDFHHDMYENDLRLVDCGNWVNCLFEATDKRGNRKLRDKSSHYYWIAREDSDDNISEECQRLGYMSKKDISFLKTLEGFECDLLFICRSGIWSPPHLDDEFINFYDWCIDHTDTWELPKVNKKVYDSRYDETMKKAITDQMIASHKVQKEFKKEV